MLWIQVRRLIPITLVGLGGLDRQIQGRQEEAEGDGLVHLLVDRLLGLHLELVQWMYISQMVRK